MGEPENFLDGVGPTVAYPWRRHWSEFKISDLKINAGRKRVKS